MNKFIHITDVHLVEQGHALYGLDPYLRLSQCLDSVIAEHADAACCVITGDLAHTGNADAYRQLASQLSRLPMPVLPILGNHDDRHGFREYFPNVVSDPNGFVQYETQMGKYRGLFLDTNEPGVSHGVFCQKRADWLSERLAQDEEPILLFMHHPAFSLGIPSMDRIALRDRDSFLTALEGHRSRIKHLFFGHIHRPISGSWLGIPFSTMRGTNHQVALHLNDTQKIIGSHEPPQYCVVLLQDESITVHIHDFLNRSDRFPLGG